MTLELYILKIALFVSFLIDYMYFRYLSPNPINQSSCVSSNVTKACTLITPRIQETILILVCVLIIQNHINMCSYQAAKQIPGPRLGSIISCNTTANVTVQTSYTSSTNVQWEQYKLIRSSTNSFWITSSTTFQIVLVVQRKYHVAVFTWIQTWIYLRTSTFCCTLAITNLLPSY